ncbi:glucuronoxylan 4-o-methyltransferase 3 [Phtheirospermum japonicum]|uniref:Glucuronoxylan 4-o-methyltransferase 3 n=1 Tax=Phtheirospermum japonicum TaxID=374723 RepID=A0A830CIU6_9LAMI|nr:glucuronoxylan 4-o-methyltransferase 3 [Phtheirospermum japonicum]
MNPKNQPSPINRKLIILSLFLLFILYVLLNSKSSSFRPIKSPSHSSSPSTCNKIPLSISESLVHYATGTDTTPQQSLLEISVTWRVLEKKSPCNFLVFGLGQDSLLWSSLNYKGRTVFLDDSRAWMTIVKKQVPSLEMYLVSYDTKVSQADELFDIGKKSASGECQEVSDPRFSKCPLALKGLPNEVYDVEWDLIMVDAPTGYFDGAPGRMSAIYTAGLMARNRENGETDVFVHDVDRVVEDRFSKALLCEGYLREQEGRIRHFNIPSHRARLGRSFCP